MSVRKLCIAILLVLPILFAQSPIAAQSFTTITNITTLTSQTTRTAYSIFTSGTSYSTTTVSPILLDSTVQVTPPENGRFCRIEFVNFDAVAHVQISGTITATSNVQVYLVSDASYQAWLSSENRYCDPSDSNVPVLTSLGPGKSFNWKWTPSADGTYWFFVDNSDTVQSPTVHLLLVSQPVATTQANYVYATVQNTIVGTHTETMTSYQTQQIQNLLPSTGNTTWITIIAVIVIIAVVAFLLLRARGRAKTTRARCIKCGAELLPRAKFCKKCGAPVE